MSFVYKNAEIEETRDGNLFLRYNQNNQQKVEVYSTKQIVGHGTFGVVYGCSSSDCVLKVPKRTQNRPQHNKLATLEVVIQANLFCVLDRDDHIEVPNILGIFITKTHGVVIKMANAGLPVHRYPAALQDATAFVHVIHTLASGLKYLQQTCKFMHRDLHLGNIMYNPNTGKCVLIDFGMARMNIPYRNHQHKVLHTDGYYPLDVFNPSHDLRILLTSMVDERSHLNVFHVHPPFFVWVLNSIRALGMYLQIDADKYVQLSHCMYDSMIGVHDHTFEPEQVARYCSNVTHQPKPSKQKPLSLGFLLSSKSPPNVTSNNYVQISSTSNNSDVDSSTFFTSSDGDSGSSDTSLQGDTPVVPSLKSDVEASPVGEQAWSLRSDSGQWWR